MTGTTKIGSIRTQPCGCMTQYGMWQPNVPSWATVHRCKRHR